MPVICKSGDRFNWWWVPDECSALILRSNERKKAKMRFEWLGWSNRIPIYPNAPRVYGELVLHSAQGLHILYHDATHAIQDVMSNSEEYGQYWDSRTPVMPNGSESGEVWSNASNGDCGLWCQDTSWKASCSLVLPKNFVSTRTCIGRNKMIEHLQQRHFRWVLRHWNLFSAYLIGIWTIRRVSAKCMICTCSFGSVALPQQPAQFWENTKFRGSCRRKGLEMLTGSLYRTLSLKTSLPWNEEI